MSLQPAIPWRVALLHCPPPLHRLDSMYHPPAETVNHHSPRAGEFSAGTLGNFQPELTEQRPRGDGRQFQPALNGAKWTRSRIGSKRNPDPPALPSLVRFG